MLDNVSKNGEVEIMGYHEKPAGHGTGRVKASLWAFTKALEELDNKQDFNAASATLVKFLRRHTKFKASCDCLDSRNVSMLRIHYAALKALLGPSSPDQRSFGLAVKTWGGFGRVTTLNAVAQFFWKELRQWYRSGGRGTMLLTQFELPRSPGVRACRCRDKLYSSLVRNPKLPPSCDGEDGWAVVRKLHRFIVGTNLSDDGAWKLLVAAALFWDESFE